MTAVTPTDRPKSVHNRCVIKVFGDVLYVVTLFFGFFCGCRGFCHRTESDLFLFLLCLIIGIMDGQWMVSLHMVIFQIYIKRLLLRGIHHL